MYSSPVRVLVLGQDAAAVDRATRLGAVAYPAGDMAVITIPAEHDPAAPRDKHEEPVQAVLLAARDEAWLRQTLNQMAVRQMDVPVVALLPGASAAFAEFALERGAMGVADFDGLTSQGFAALLRRAFRRHQKRARRRRVYSQLWSSTSSLQRVIKNNADAIVVVNRDGVIRFLNPAAEILFARPACDLVHQHFGFPLSAGETTEIDVVRPGGQTVAAEMRVVETQWEGEPVYLASLRDITERKRAELARISLAREQAARAQAEENERRSSFLAETSRVLASSLDYQTVLHRIARLTVPFLADACVVDLLNNRGEPERVAAVHIDPDGAGLLRQIHEKQPFNPAHRNGLAAVLRTGRPEVFDGLTDDDYQKWAEDPELLGLVRRLAVRGYICVPLLARERVIGVITLLATVSNRHYNALDLALAEELAKRAAMAVENARLFHEARHANAAKDRFLAVLSHELRTPLTPVLLSLTALDHHDVSPDIRAQLEVIKRNIQLETRLIDDILDLTRIVQGKLRLQPQPVDLKHIVSATLDICCSMADIKGITLSVRVPDHPVVVWGDAARLQQVLWNVLNNAIKFTPDNGVITLQLSAADGEAIIRVKDSGIGIPPDALSRVFNAFEQVERRVTDSYGGLGLGLTIAKAILDLHRGRIGISSDGLHTGTEVTVALPQSAEAAAPARVRTSSPPARPHKPARILLVEDHPDTRHLMRKLLTSFGHEVTAVGTLHDARASLNDGKAFDVLVSDISLPDGSGLDLMPEFQRRHGGGGIAVSGFGMDHDVRRSAEAGFSTHLTKPVDMMELLRAIDGAARGTPA
jgi:signal transduction histidine kinase/PAS domain-containing protein